MKRKLEILFTVFVFASFFLPWIPYMDMVSSTPLNGFYFMMVMLFGGLMGSLRAVPMGFVFLITGISLVVTLGLCTKIILKDSETLKARVTVFLLTWGVFLLHITISTVMGMNRGLMFLESLKYQISFIRYGLYVGLAASLLLLMVGRKRVDDTRKDSHSLMN